MFSIPYSLQQSVPLGNLAFSRLGVLKFNRTKLAPWVRLFIEIHEIPRIESLELAQNPLYLVLFQLYR